MILIRSARIRRHLWRLRAVARGFGAGLFALAASAQMAHAPAAIEAAKARVGVAADPVAVAPAGAGPHGRIQPSGDSVVQRTAATAVEGGAKVSIANFEFTPGEIIIVPGESVTWTNDDGAPHGLEFHDGAKGTDLLLPEASFSRRFDKPGIYDYNCSVHPYMTGRVVVRAQ